ncbi:flagellar hook-basal body complex protein FliE [Sphingosinicella sp.]|uniref:flagellar hook-basal body complex protein FliE n=1 Tax=Sphingosinicella sp. TaxID=1917971 RepID=UPI004037C12D
MTGIEAIAATATSANDPMIARLGMTQVMPAAQGAEASSFGSILTSGLRQVDARVASANYLVRRFALDDNVPLHQVTYALEEARLAVELATQVRARLVESYRELMNMQL